MTLAERYGGHEARADTYEAMIARGQSPRRPFVAEKTDGGIDRIHMLGTSGTVTTIAGVYLDLPRYERRRVDGCWMSDAQVTDVVERLLAMSYEERVANPCIGAERADLVLAGCAILEAIRRAFPCERLRVADRGLREGMLVQMMREDGVWGGSGEARTPAEGVGEDRQGTARCRRSSGSNASSTTLTWRAPSARAFARAPPTS